MGKFTQELRPQDIKFIARQKMFFTATAPIARDGHINLSPKGLDSFRIISPNKVAYLDLNGSGNETSAHLLENGRITIMFCAYDGPPNILRLYGTGYTVLPEDAGWEALHSLFNLSVEARQIIVVDVHQVQNSCGYSVPYYNYEGERDHAQKWCDKKGSAGLQQYQQDKNLLSLDGLPTAIALRNARAAK